MSEQTPATRGTGAVAVLVLVAGVVTVLVAAGAGAYYLSEWVADRQSQDGAEVVGADRSSAGVEPAARGVKQLISVAGFEQLVEALEEETGDAEVVDLVVYPDYAVVDVPLPGGKGRIRSLYYDGDIRETGLGTSDDAPLDLRRVDAAMLVDLSRTARRAVEDPDQWYLVLHAPDVQDTVVHAYASNKYGEGGYVAARLDGKVVNRVGW